MIRSLSETQEAKTVKSCIRFIAITAISLVGLELLLWTTPLPDPYPSTVIKRFHRFLPSWNYWAWPPVGGKEPPFKDVFYGGHLIGIEPRPALFQVNPYGYLYPIEKHRRRTEQEVRIAVIGGSTVECIALQPEKRWPAILERLLRSKNDEQLVSVLNLGISDQSTPTHLATLVQHAIKLDLDAIVYMLGANELQRAADNWQPMLNTKSYTAIDMSRTSVVSYLLTRTQTGRRIQAVRYPGEGLQVSGEQALNGKPYFSEVLAMRLQLPLLPHEPKIPAAALQDYKKDILSLAAIAQEHDIRVLFTTQPMLWKETPLPEEEGVDWLGMYEYQGKNYRLAARTSARLLESLNQQLLQTCREQQLACLDLASGIPRSLEYFYDPVHFNEKGAERVAELVASSLSSHGLELQARPREFTRLKKEEEQHR